MKKILTICAISAVVAAAVCSCKGKNQQSEDVDDSIAVDETFEEDDPEPVDESRSIDTIALYKALVDSLKAANAEEDVERVDGEETAPVNVLPLALVDKKPLFNTGEDNAFEKWVSSHLVYPSSCKSEGREGKVEISFIVSAQGKVKEVTVSKSSGNASFDKEAVRVVESSPSWKVGESQGEPVDVVMTVPVVFSLD